MRAVSPKRAKLTRSFGALRQQVIDRDATCVICGNVGTDVHHRKQRSLGGQDTLENLLWLCHACHMDVHDEIGLYTSLGFLVRSWEAVGNVCVWVNRDGMWGAPDVDWWFLPLTAARYMPTGPIEKLRDRLDARGRLFTLVHNAIPNCSTCGHPGGDHDYDMNAASDLCREGCGCTREATS